MGGGGGATSCILSIYLSIYIYIHIYIYICMYIYPLIYTPLLNATRVHHVVAEYKVEASGHFYPLRKSPFCTYVPQTAM